jgi:O-antigen ligase
VKAHMILFFICALALAAEDCRKLVLANIAGCFALLFECVRFGVADENGRLAIPTSISFSNPNDLGLQLVVSIGLFVYLVVSKSWLARIAGLVGMLASFYFMLRTASRGSEIACGVMALVAVVFTSYRFKVILLAIPVAIVVLSMPGDTLHRLSLIFLNPAAESFATARDRASVGSQMERQELLLASIEYMFTHPIFGIGPGQFSDYRWMTSRQVGEHVASLGTHNSYTEIGSECGVPALFCYAGVIFWSIRSNYRILKRTQSDPDRQLFARLSLCLLMSTLGFAVNAFFHHSGYSGYVPFLGGLSIVLFLAADPVQNWPDQPGKR